MIEPHFASAVDALPNGSYVEVADSGHFPEVEAGQEFTRVVLGFLASTRIAQ
jgi:pimeloyl-ACP methyl ester carboxylesterase